MEDTILTKEEVSKLLKCSERQVDVLRANYDLPWYRVGHFVRFSKQSVTNWLRNQEQVGNACPSLKGGKYE